MIETCRLKKVIIICGISICCDPRPPPPSLPLLFPLHIQKILVVTSDPSPSLQLLRTSQCICWGTIHCWGKEFNAETMKILEYQCKPSQWKPLRNSKKERRRQKNSTRGVLWSSSSVTENCNCFVTEKHYLRIMIVQIIVQSLPPMYALRVYGW